MAAEFRIVAPINKTGAGEVAAVTIGECIEGDFNRSGADSGDCLTSAPMEQISGIA